MTNLRNIDIAEFTAEVKYRREEALALVGTSSLVSNYRDALRTVCQDDCWKIAQPAPAFTVPTTADHEAAFFCGGQLVPDHARPTETQIRYLAKLATEAGEQTCFSGRLTRAAASNLINDYLRC